MTNQSARLAPVGDGGRIQSLDVLRGIAVFGILLMNITAFGLLFQAYGNPLVEGGATGANLAVYKVITVMFEGTMRGIFSLLFGAGIVLLTERMENGGAGLMTAEIHFRRMVWMLLFGFIHWALMLWIGEILFAYAMCGLVLFSVRKISPKLQLAVAAVLLLAAAYMGIKDYHDIQDASVAAASAEHARATGATLTADQSAALEGWAEVQSHFVPTKENAAEQRDWHSGSYWNAVQGQFPMAYEFQWATIPRWLLTDMIPFMLIGMAFLKFGILGGQLPARIYAGMLVIGYGIGIPLGIYELNFTLAGNFSPVSVAEAGRTYQFSRLAMVVGHLGLFLLIIRLGIFKALQRGLAAAGQMALTNYLMQTIICTFLFYGFGLGLYGQLQRYELYYVVLAICTVELVWSVIWLRYFRFGPFEWLWRSLTYWKRQPMALDQKGPPPAQILGAT